jgi:L-2-hydroxyglutarate oxidase LhgO
MLALQTPVTGGRAGDDGIELEAGMTLLASTVVNAAGLRAPAVAASIAGMPGALVPTPYLAKGNYFSLAGRAPFSRLIYPVPVPGGLGTHLTLDLGGQARFGPDVEWVEREDYDVDPARGAGFYAAIRRWWPELRDGALSPAYSGIRPKLVPRGVAGQDFVVQTAREHGVAGLVNLFGIESPGLTAAIALADLVRDAAG